MRNLITGFIIGITILACSGMGGKRAKRLIIPMDHSKTPWEFCTPEMIPDYKGKMCLIECAIEIKKDGTCKKDKYKYISKVLKDEHEYFMNKYIAVPEGEFY